MTEASHEHHRKRLRERALQHITRVSDQELLELLLTYVIARKDTAPMACDLWRRFGNFRTLLDAGALLLQQTTGIGERTVDFFTVFKEVRRRYDESPITSRLSITNNQLMFEAARGHLGSLTIEEVWVAMLDSALRLLCWKQIASGGINSAFVNVQELMRDCIVHRASGFIIIHNHPGGTTAPSPQDIALTKKLMEAADTVGLQVYEHLVVTETAYRGLIAEHLV